MIKTLKRLSKYLSDDAIIIYQMGKVGSTSIEESIKNYSKNVIHIHSLYSQNAYDHFKNYQSIKFYVSLKERIRYKIFAYLKRYILRRNKRIKIITLVREPISRNISMFFQDIHIPIFEIAKFFDNRYEENVNNEMIYKMYIDKFNHEYGVDWFDKELKRAFNIDIYDYNFDKEKGFSIIKKDNINLLVIKMEKLNELEKQIGDFLEIEDFKLKNVNISSKKWYADLYKDFKKKFSPSEEYIDTLYNSRYMKHFYSEEEINHFRNKWLKNNKSN
ncbi:hypothetical protein BHF71_00985 [Vulcanibacillus modesticaldus]|uniref:Capsular biosynthesis protein n=1 Tax=Vulcanibacillus modesticaldus TaxID=337097 RepID=A0A1D2YVN5_9BACI|nr:putative capsular polysaccharide synthesis family protein [Vulcanibacillus modesticaldus]OEF99782.1 hypothetical protein BHF71_00985 [Vulcanibacillus modesticaldus]